MFSKSTFLALAICMIAIASGAAPASAAFSQAYAGRYATLLPGPDLPPPAGLRTVQRSMYPMPRRPIRQPFQ